VANEKGAIGYYNSGCWTEKPCHYLTVRNGGVELRSYTEAISEEVLELVRTVDTVPSVA
jgi:hypothetical protein